MFLKAIKQKAIELSNTGSASNVLEVLKCMPEFKDKVMSTERTINRWRNEAKSQRNEGEIEISGGLLIRNGRVYKKIMDIPPWAKNPPKQHDI